MSFRIVLLPHDAQPYADWEVSQDADEAAIKAVAQDAQGWGPMHIYVADMTDSRLAILQVALAEFGMENKTDYTIYQ